MRGSFACNSYCKQSRISIRCRFRSCAHARCCTNCRFAAICKALLCVSYPKPKEKTGRFCGISLTEKLFLIETGGSRGLPVSLFVVLCGYLLSQCIKLFSGHCEGIVDETVLNNIRISELELDADLQREKNRARKMPEKVSLEFAQQDDAASGLDMLCAREFGGTDLSGGQWQKLAAARMLYRDRDFVVLDEPTAAIDPVSEYQLFDLFEKETKDKTAVIITHRMASIRFCNKIIVLQDGEIESVGDHETLMRTSPLYYQLYHAVEECYE